MKRSLIVLFLFFVSGCHKSEEFVPDAKYLYAPVWKVWDITYVDDKAGGASSSITDIDTRYKFTDSVTYLSLNSGTSYIHYTTNHLSLDSIAFVLVTPETTDLRRYKVNTMYLMADARPPQDEDRQKRDALFPELQGKFLFLRLQNKKKVTIENRQMTEYLLLYN